MTFGEFLSDRLRRTALQLVCAAAAALFLAATGTQVGIIVILLLVLLLIFLTVQTVDLLHQHFRLLELESILDGLDKKYLFTECVSPPKDLYERHLFDLTRRTDRGLITRSIV